MKKRECAAILCFMSIVVGMIAAAEALGQREIIFPEMAALGIGCFLAPGLPWKTNGMRMVLCIELCALLGVGIVLWVPLPLWGQASLAYIVGQIVLLYSGTSLAPMLSAIVLPVLLQTRSIVYPVAALTLMLMLCLMRYILERCGIRERKIYRPLPRPVGSDWRAFVFRSCFVAIFTCVCILGQEKFCMAPPLLVAFTELCRPDCPAGKRRISVFLLVGLCSAAGVVARVGLVMVLGLPCWVAAAVIAATVLLLVKGFRLYFPPAGAMAVLALLIPEEAVNFYAVQVCIGAAVLLTASALWVRRQERRNNASAAELNG